MPHHSAPRALPVVRRPVSLDDESADLDVEADRVRPTSGYTPPAKKKTRRANPDLSARAGIDFTDDDYDEDHLRAALDSMDTARQSEDYSRYPLGPMDEDLADPEEPWQLPQYLKRAKKLRDQEEARAARRSSGRVVHRRKKETLSPLSPHPSPHPLRTKNLA